MRRAVGMLAIGLLDTLAACYDPNTVEGLPCVDDEGCGPQHVCTLGYCRQNRDDALADCGDGMSARGEFCYPLSGRQSLPLGDASLRVASWADLDGDGLTDVLTTSDAGTLVHLNLGGTFNASVLAVELPPASLAPLELPNALADVTLPVRPVRATLGDFTGDPLPDAVFSLEIAGEVPEQLQPVQDAIESWLWLADNQSITATPPVLIPGSAPLGLAEIPFDGIQTGDFDGDGLDDVLVAAVEEDETIIRWLRGSPDGPQPPQRLAIPGSTVVDIADIDEDGRDDLVVLYRAAGVLSWLRGPFDGQPDTLDLGGPAVAMHTSALDDQPGLELVILTQDPPLRRLWSWTGAGFEDQASLLGSTQFDVAAGDLDGDGWPELVTVGQDGVAVHSGFAGPQFGASFTIVDEPSAVVELRMLDDDEVPDLVLRSDDRLVVRFANP